MDINNLDEHKVHTFVLEKVTGHSSTVVLQATTMDELRTLVDIMVESKVDSEVVSTTLDQKDFEEAMQYAFQPYEFEVSVLVHDDEDEYYNESFFVERTEIITMDRFA